jgi:hypothetical protein
LTNLKWAFKSKTANIRRSIIYGAARILTPVMYGELKAVHEYTHKLPRPFTQQLKQAYGDKPLVGAEIGFGLGLNAQNILDTLNIKRLYCIDPTISRQYQDGQLKVQAFVDKPSNYTKLKTDPRVVFIEKPSIEAVAELDEQLDFVYIDGLHNYQSCLNDITNYYPLVKQGGYIGGHDFTKFLESDVVKAVFAFAASYGVAPSVTMPDYWFKIPTLTAKQAIDVQYLAPDYGYMEDEIKGTH